MKLSPLLLILTLVGCSNANRNSYDLTVASVSTGDDDHREVELRFEIPPETEIRVTADGATSTLFADRLNSEGTFKVKLSVARNAKTEDGKHAFTTLVRPETPTGGFAGGPSTYYFDNEKSLDDILDVTAVSTSVPLGKLHTVGSRNGKPIQLVVKPKAATP